MVWYWIAIAVLILILCVLILVIRHIISSDSSKNPSALMITTGVSLIVSAFPGIKEILVSILASFIKITVVTENDYVAIVCGFILILLGFFYVIKNNECVAMQRVDVRIGDAIYS